MNLTTLTTKCAVAWLALNSSVTMVHAAELIEPFDGGSTSGWTSYSAGTSVTNPGGYLSFTFNVQGIPALVQDTAHVQLGVAVRLTNIVFRLRAEQRDPSAIKLSLHATTNQHTWKHVLELPGSTNWMTYSVPVNASGKWSIGPGGSTDLFNADLALIDVVGIEVRRHGSTEEQRFAIDDFTLQGLAITPGDLDGDGLPDEWENTHALNANDPSDAPLDADSDGMSNYAEFRAGTNPNDERSVFLVSIAEEDRLGGTRVEGVVIRWSSISNRTYAVWRALNVGEAPYEFVQGNIPADPPVNEFTDRSATNTPGRFYYVEVE